MFFTSLFWYPRPDSNRHAMKATDFKSVMSTIPSRGHFDTQGLLPYAKITIAFANFSTKVVTSVKTFVHT